MRQWLAYIFITIFSFQILPVKEIGKILFKGQVTEEVHEADTAKMKKGTDPFRLYPVETGQAALIQYINTRVTLAIILSERLPRQFVPDILTPPPNCA